MAKINFRAVKKTFSLLVAASLLLQQTGFAQVVQQLDFGRYLAGTKASADIFRPMHMRYFSYDDLQGGFNLLLDKGDNKDINDAAIKEQSKVVFDYFLTGISLPNDTFWVNLRPDAEDDIIDDRLARTDMGKVMLEADLQLKKDLALFTSPENPKGKEYWDQLYQKAGELFGAEKVSIPTLTRPWIAPGEVIVRYSDNSAYVYKATLKVVLEQDLLKDSAAFKFDDPRLKTLNEYSSQLIRQLIIPELTKEVNTAKRYAGLRQVFYSLILAQCFKLKLNHDSGVYAKRVNSGDLTGLTSGTPWSKSVYYKEYKQSFKDGEYNIRQAVPSLAGQVIRSYSSGGAELGLSPETAGGAFIPAGAVSTIGPGQIAGHVGVTIIGDNLGITLPTPPADTGSAGFEGLANAAYGADIAEAVRPPRANSFSRKVTLPYARDNAVYRTAVGRRNVKQHMREVLDEVEDKVLTVVFGKDFEGGKQVIKRTQTDANLGWTDMIREQHPDGLRFLLAQEKLTQEGIPALMKGDYQTYNRCLKEYQESWTNTSRAWLSLILAARRGEKGLPLWVYARAKNIEDNAKEYYTFIELFNQFERGEADPDTYDLYAPGEIGRAIELSVEFNKKTGLSAGVVAFPLGAGGFGSVCALAGESRQVLMQFLDFLEENGIHIPQLIKDGETAVGKSSITAAEAEDLVAGRGKYATGRHTFAFWVSAKADVDGVIMKDVEGWNDAPVLKDKGIQLQLPVSLPWVLVNQNTLEMIPLGENEDVDSAKYGPEWIVAKSWELGFDWQTCFRPDMSLLSEANIKLINQRIAKNGFKGVWPRLWKWAKENNKKILISVPARWLDTLGSSWDLKDFRLEGTPEGDLRLTMLPARNAIPSEYRLEIEVSTIAASNMVEYSAEQYFSGIHRVNPNKVINVDKAEDVPAGFDGLAFVKHPNPQQAARGIRLLHGKEKNAIGLFAHLFGITGGVRFTCSKMSFVPRQGGMESSNIFTDSVAAIFNMLSGANFSVAEISHISLLAQINECNNITGNQGADAAWAGAGLHIYMGGMYDMKAKRDFAAVVFYPSGEAKQVSLQYETEHPAWGINRYSAAVEQQNIQLTTAQLQVLERARELVPEEAQNLLDNNTLIFLSLTDGKTAHRSLGRSQIEMDVSLLQEGKEKELAIRLWHEAMERQVILASLNELGLSKQFESTRLNPRARETILVTAGRREMTLTELINALSIWVHNSLQSATLETLESVKVENLVAGAVTALRGKGDRGRGPDVPPPSAPPGDSGPKTDRGGIEFRYIDLMAQFQQSDLKADFKMPELAALRGLDLAAEREQIDNMIAAKIIPSADRLTNYISACRLREGPQKGTADAIACLTNFFKLEEERGVQTDPQLKSFLFFMESSSIR